MRVLYFTERDSPHDQRFLQNLAITSHQVFALRQFACNPQTPSGIVELHWPKGLPDWLCWPGWEQGKKQLLTLLSETQPDVVHAGPVQGPAFLTALTSYHPLVTMSWGSDLLRRADRSPWMRYITRYVLNCSDLLLVDCQTVANAAVNYGFSSDRIVRFPWGVDLEHFSPISGYRGAVDLRQSLHWEDKFVILCNRSWLPLYGVDVLAKAFVTAINNNENLRLLLVGDGPQAGQICEILSGVSQYTYLPGWYERSELPGVYCAVDLYVSPSHSDGSSISLLEAMACGRPALVSDIPSNQEWVTPGVTGDLFPDGDPQVLCAKILQMAEDPHLKDYGKEARVVAEERADWRINFQKLLGAYQQARQSMI